MNSGQPLTLAAPAPATRHLAAAADASGGGGSGFYEKAMAAAAAAGSASKRSRLVDAPGDFISLDLDAADEDDSAPAPEFADARDAKDALRVSPWSGGRSYNRPVSDSSTLLHEEILDFAHFMAPTEAEVAARNKIVGQLTAIVKGRWPNCELQVRGVIERASALHSCSRRRCSGRSRAACSCPPAT